MEQEQSTFEGYAIVEIMGHNREIGYVRTEYFGGPALFRIDQPPISARERELTRAEWIGDVLAGPGSKVQRVAIPGKTAFVGPQAVFRMTPCDEATALEAIERMIHAPVKVLSLVEPPKQLTESQRSCQCGACPYCDGECTLAAVDGGKFCEGCANETSEF